MEHWVVIKKNVHDELFYVMVDADTEATAEAKARVGSVAEILGAFPRAFGVANGWHGAMPVAEFGPKCLEVIEAWKRTHGKPQPRDRWWDLPKPGSEEFAAMADRAMEAVRASSAI